MAEGEPRERHVSSFVNMVRDPVPVYPDALDCRGCKKEKLGKMSEGRAVCRRCGCVHVFIRIGGRVHYGVSL